MTASEERKKMQSERPGGFTAGRPGDALGRPVEKPKDFSRTLRRLAGYFGPERIKLSVVLATALLGQVFSILGPKILGLATTKLFTGLMGRLPAQSASGAAQPAAPAGIDFTYIGEVLLLALGLYIVSAAFTYVQQYVMSGVAQRTTYRLRAEVEAKLNRLPLKFFDSRTHGEILSRAVNDMDNLSSTLQQSLTQIITSVVTLIGVLVMMLIINPLLTVIVVLTMPLSLFVVTNIARQSQTYFRNQQRSLGQLNGHVEEMYTGHKIVKAFGREPQARDTFRR
ncbi:MAG TPA: ABC transporter ATP-binding protein, partial [Candidatus Edwardsbacteria bacterium]|nr:ABC transporter ATP-binding protein [Candidatus Edwardsbacteria bacterium]